MSKFPNAGLPQSTQLATVPSPTVQKFVVLKARIRKVPNDIAFSPYYCNYQHHATFIVFTAGPHTTTLLEE